MMPLLGILIWILSLFGQEPDSVIKAFTETADWNLSIKILAQNLNMIDITIWEVIVILIIKN